ncbi:MAG: efflux RND transporter permease subunit [Candidatus Eisenbacteria bacterium]
MSHETSSSRPRRSRRAGRSWIDPIVRFCLERKLVVLLTTLVLATWGAVVAPFSWNLGVLPRDPVPADAIPDLGENQQIIFTEWPGRSPQDVEDQLTYPLSVALLGVPGVETVRTYSMFGFSTIYLIFEEDVEFYWSRSRILEKLASLPSGTLPPGVQPALGPDATALGQVFWYTLEGRDASGEPTGGWDLDELRSIQDFQVKYALLSADGVAEVASVGGFVREYQIDLDPDAMRAYGVGLDDVANAVRMSNNDVGARTMEINQVEYLVRGIGFVRSTEDLEAVVVKSVEGTPVYLRQIANVGLGPAERRGVLDKEGAEVVGGVVVVRHGANPLETIESVKAKIAQISAGLPERTLEDGTVSRVTIVPFYDRTELIHETLGTLRHALRDEILVTILVVLVLVLHVRGALLVSLVLPLSVLLCFVGMKLFRIDANVVALSGIAIAIGTMVDMGIVITENVLSRVRKQDDPARTTRTVFLATREVGTAVLTAVATTVVGFLPVFAMTGPEGKLFGPLAFTKTFALMASALVAVIVLPPLTDLLLRPRRGLLGGRGASAGATEDSAAAVDEARRGRAKGRWSWLTPSRVGLGLLLFVVLVWLSRTWSPLGPEQGGVRNFVFVALVMGGLLFLLLGFQRTYPRLLSWSLRHKAGFLSLPLALTLLGAMIWLGFDALFGWLPQSVRTSGPVSQVTHVFPGLGKEFMPPLDEGSFLLMPTTMPHASLGEAKEVLQAQDMAIDAIPEVETAVGKIGRVDSALDPAPISMVETVITYSPTYLQDENGERLRFRFDRGETDYVRDVHGTPLLAPDGKPYLVRGKFERTEDGALVPDDRGRPFRLWRPALDPALNPGREAWPGIRDADDIWRVIEEAARIPGTTGAPKLQPIAARLVMLQSGMRAPMGIQVSGPDLASIEQFGLGLEKALAEVPTVEPNAVTADRIVGKPYLEIRIDREAIARYGLHVRNVQDVIETAIGGRAVTRTVEGRERYDVRLRYARELREDLDDLRRVLVATPAGAQVPLGQLAVVEYVRGPQMIKGENTFLVGYVLFDKKPGFAEVDVVEQAAHYIEGKIASGDLVVPRGVSYEFAGSYQNQVHAQRTLSWVLPLALAAIFVILYLQFGSLAMTSFVFSAVGVAWAGGFVLLWLYGRSWFLDFGVFGVSMQSLFGVHPLNLSVAVWVGFLALFGIATDDGVIVGTYLGQSFAKRRPTTVDGIRKAALEAGSRRIRPCLMTTGTTLLALLPVLSSTGRGAEIMVPMAIPSFGGVLFVLLNTLMVPVLYAWKEERKLRRRIGV